MNILRRAALFGLAVNKIQADAVVKLYGLVGLYRRLYRACGMPEDVAARIEEKMLKAANIGVEEQFELTCRWVRGEINFFGFIDEYQRWFAAHVERCTEVAMQEFCAAA